MSTIFPFLLCVTVLGAADARGAVDAGPTRGKVLVLENEQTLSGDIERVGDAYRVRRLTGETAVPADRALRLCGSMEEAYAFVRDRANLTDPDEHLRLAEWCRVNGLHEQALAEVKAAVDLRPDHPASRRLLAFLQDSRPAQPANGGHDESSSDAPKASVDLTEEALGRFAARVQPILMNACANCHATGRGGAFKLTRAYDSAVLNRKTMQQNLVAVLGEVNLAQPQNSMLLAKAVSVHGPLEQAPIRNRQAAAYKTLEEWVKGTVADNPQLREQPLQPRDQPAAKPGATPFAEARPMSDKDQTEPGNSQNTPATAATTASPPAAAPPPTNETPQPADPYSADAFNRQYHGDSPRPKPGPQPKP
jgi:hypothetical protein